MARQKINREESVIFWLGIGRGWQSAHFIGCDYSDLALAVALIFKDIGNDSVLQIILNQINCIVNEMILTFVPVLVVI